MFAASTAASLGSPSSVYVDSSSGFFNNYDDEVIILEFSADSFSNSQVTIPASEINQQLSEGRVEDDLTLKLVNKETEARYGLRDGGRRDGNSVDYKRHKIEWGNQFLAPGQEQRWNEYESWARNNCEDVDGSNGISYYVTEGLEGWMDDQLYAHVTCAAFQTDTIGNVAEIESTPNIVMRNTFAVNGHEKTISNLDQSVTFSSNGVPVVKLNFQGGLETGWNYPQPDDELAAFTNSDGTFLISKSGYDNTYMNHLDRAENDDAKDLLDNNPTEAILEQQSRDLVENVFTRYDESEFYQQFSTTERTISRDGTGLEGGILSLNGGERETAYSQIQVLVKADELNYYIPEATPYIESVETPTLKEGRTGYIEATIGNQQDATGQGSFNVYLDSCSQEFATPDTSEDLQLDPGETGSVQLAVSGNTDNMEQAEITGQCTLNVDNLRDSSDNIQQTVDLTLEQDQECEPEEYFSQVNDAGNFEIWQCGANGLQKEFVKECGEDQKTAMQNGEMVCVTTDSSDGDGNDGDSAATRWVPNQEQTSCISNQYEQTPYPDNSFSDKQSCLNYIGQDTTCFIDFEFAGPLGTAGQTTDIEFLCFKQSTLDKARLAIILVSGLAVGGIGYRVGQGLNGEQQIQGRNKYYTRRQNIDREARGDPTSRTAIAGLLIGFTLGAVIGWYLGFWSLVVAGGLAVAKYLLPAY